MSSTSSRSKMPLYLSSVKTNGSQRSLFDPLTNGPEPTNGNLEITVAQEAPPYEDNSLSVQSEIYHHNHFADWWLYLTLTLHFLLFGILLGVGYHAINLVSLAVLIAIVIVVPILIFVGRLSIRKAPKLRDYKYRLTRTVEDESDYIPDSAIYIFTAAAILEGLAFAIYPTSSVSHAVTQLNISGFYSFDTLVQALRFSSLTLYGFHRLLRPSNRLDPLRTILELEIVSVCWDAIDGSTLYELIGKVDLPDEYNAATRVLMVFWYASVGVRLGMMFSTHVSVQSFIYPYVLSYPLKISRNPVVDRSLQALRLRSSITSVMGIAEFFAGGLRIGLWKEGLLDSVQQEMMLKNILFVASIASAYSTYSSAEKRAWNERKFLCILKPSRTFQRQCLRWLFILTYFVTSALLTSYVLKGDSTGGNLLWIVNVGADITLCLFFVTYCGNVHNRKRWIIFPGKIGAALGILLGISLYGARLPALYLLEKSQKGVGEDWSFANALFVVAASVVPICFYTLYWSISYMLFYPEYSACPGRYHAIHDPVVTAVSVAYMTEGALDILSCTALMALASYDLPEPMHVVIIICTLLEVLNACQCFALQSLMAGVIENTPAQLVLWKANLRAGRGVIDFIVFVVRIALWVRYNAVSSVFLVKNIYNLLHGVSLVERAAGVKCYNPRETLFMGFVAPQDWYDMTDEQWRQEVTTEEKVVT